AGFLIPHHRGLALVGDSNRSDILRIDIALLQRALDHALRALPDLIWAMFDPAGPGVDLLMLFLLVADNLARVIEDHEAWSGCALVDSGGILCHGCDLLVLGIVNCKL